MVENQLRTYDVLDYDTLDVMGRLPREIFVAPERQAMAYLDQSIAIGDNRALMCPMVFGRLLQALEVKPTDRVLDVAGATGYSAAAFAMIAAHVVALEDDADLLELARANFLATGTAVETVLGDIAAGHPAGAPYDVIFVNGAVEIEPARLLEQLSPNGRLGTILGSHHGGRAIVYRRSGDAITAHRIVDADAMPLKSFQKPLEFSF